MKAFFSRHLHNSNGDSSSSMQIPPTNRDVDNKRSRTISTRSLFDKNRVKQGNANHYAEPQDLLYPSNASLGNISSAGKSPIMNQSLSKKQGNIALASVSIPSDGVGGAPTSPQSIHAPGPGKRSSKAIFATFRSNTSPLMNGKNRTKTESRNGVNSSASKMQESATNSEAAPFYVVAPRSMSTPAHSSRKAREEKSPPAVPSKDVAVASAHGLDLEPLSAKTQDFALSAAPLGKKSLSKSAISFTEQDENTTPTQETVSSFAGPLQSKSRYLDVTGHSSSSKSAPTSPLFTTQLNTSPKLPSSANEDTFSIKKSMRRFKGTTEDRIVEGGNEGSNSFHDSHELSPSQLLNSRPTQMASRSQDLASELNELAVAHEEGLLGEDEYRMLRQNVFNKMMGRGEMEVPKEGRVQGRAAYANGGQTDDSDKATLPPASVRSKRSSKSNLTSLFRRGSKHETKNNSNNNSNGLPNPASSSKSAFLSAGDSIHSGASRSIRSRKSASTLLETQVSQARRARTMRSKANPNTIDESAFQGYPQVGGGGMNASRKGSSIYSASGISMGGVSMSSGNALLGGNYLDKSSDEINAEVAVVEAESRRILESFKSLQMNAIGRYNLNFEMMKRAVSGIGLDSNVESDFFDDFVMVDGQDGGFADEDKSQSNGSGDLIGGLIRKTKSFGQLDSLTNGQSRRTKSKDGLSLAPISYKGVPGYPHSPNSTSPLDSQESTDDEEIEVAKLRAELNEIFRRRNEVAKKYSDRLAFLRSNLRSAKIRERLH